MKFRFTEKKSEGRIPIRTVSVMLKDWMRDINWRQYNIDPRSTLQNKSLSDTLAVAVYAYHKAYRTEIGNFPQNQQCILWTITSRNIINEPFTTKDFRNFLTELGDTVLNYGDRHDRRLLPGVLRRSVMKCFAKIMEKDQLRFIAGHLSDKTLNQFYGGMTDFEKSLVLDQLSMDFSNFKMD